MIKFSSHSGINTLKVSQELDITLDEAWSFFSNPKNLSEITPMIWDLILLQKFQIKCI
jgi:ligand-binding SRPBCC domain-containing protein